MQIIRDIAMLHRAVTALKQGGKSVALVPTMGSLHDGHLSLVRMAKRVADHAVVSIFVNPTQFGPNEDFEAYPRDEARDAALLVEEGASLLWAPDVATMYPGGHNTHIEVAELGADYCGAARPGHFDGVATVVAILFNLVGAERAYFGQKDAQQVLVIRQMARDLSLQTEVVACPTVREPDGLALSSRNVHLSPEERAAAPVLRRALLAARANWESGERNGEKLREAMRRTLAEEPLATPAYVSVADGRSLEELDLIEGPALLSLAVRFGATRLIDNEALDGPPDTGADSG